MNQKDIKLLRYNYNDLVRYSGFDIVRPYVLLKHIYDRNWDKLLTYESLLKTDRWCNYILNFDKLVTAKIPLRQKSYIIRLASYRDISSYLYYNDLSIDLDLLPVSKDKLLKLPLIEIKNDKLYLKFEQEKNNYVN
jgi:hypothetical protein